MVGEMAERVAQGKGCAGAVRRGHTCMRWAQPVAGPDNHTPDTHMAQYHTGIVCIVMGRQIFQIPAQRVAIHSQK